MLNKNHKMISTNRTYRHLVEVWDLKSEIENKVGDMEQVPTLVNKLWCEVTPVRGREYVEMERLVPEMQYKITTRYREFLNQAHILKWQGRELNIKAIVDINAQQEHIEIMCIEKVKT